VDTGITKALCVCGVVAGPLFTVAWIVEGATRVNYDPMRCPISSLSIGDGGWMQIATFIITGLLVLAFAIGLRCALRPSGSVWGPALVGLVGTGLIGAGIFVTDPTRPSGGTRSGPGPSCSSKRVVLNSPSTSHPPNDPSSATRRTGTHGLQPRRSSRVREHPYTHG
jgi:Protein of unknown function (DUF998)